jgi:hypothetical protein
MPDEDGDADRHNDMLERGGPAPWFPPVMMQRLLIEKVDLPNQSIRIRKVQQKKSDRFT